MDHSFELRELFHLHFLRHLGARLAGRSYAVKGGIALRFFHRSPRLSEDIDLDVAPALPVGTLQKAVDGVLSGAGLRASLVPHGIGRLLFSRPKQTTTTQRWKVSLFSVGGLPISTRLEFSRRRHVIEAHSGMPDAGLLRRYYLSPFAVQFYSAEAMAAQKIAALASPSRTAARDLFDLYHLFFVLEVSVTPDAALRPMLGPAAEKARHFEYHDFRDQVLPYLPDDLAAHYGQTSAFEGLRMHVEEKTDGALAMKRSGVGLLQIIQHQRLRIFTTADILTLTGMKKSAGTHALQRLRAHELIGRLKRGVWFNRLAPGLDPYEAVPYLTAPWPAYISLQSALSRQGLIEESPSMIFAVSSGPPKTCRTSLAAFHIHHLPEALIWGYQMGQSGPGQYLLAEPEKAFLDLAYLGLTPRSSVGFPYKRDRRWRLDRKKLRRYAHRFHYPPLIAFLKKIHLFLLLATVLSSRLLAAERCAYQPNGLESGVLDELNLVRKDPPGYAFHLEDLEDSYHGKNRTIADGTYLVTQEGLPALEEAVHVLQGTPPRGPLVWDVCLSASAAEHVRDTGPPGLVGHESSHGEPFEVRIKRHLKRYQQVGENIDYGSATARDVVEQLLIDDGVPDRGHRKNMLDRGFNAAGIACGPHAKFGTMCVIDFARE